MSQPAVTIYNRQRRVRLDLAWVKKIASAAGPVCAEHSGDGMFALKNLPEIEVSVVSDKTIGRVHADFLGDPTPTDVITFQHGELVVSADMAAARAPEFGHSVEAELALYIVHGLLHLNGYDDTTSAAARKMRAKQDRLWRLLLNESSTTSNPL